MHMTKTYLQKIYLVFLIAFIPVLSYAQVGAGLNYGIGPGLKKGGLFSYLSPDSSSYIRFNMVAQSWLRYNQNNPGSTIVDPQVLPANGQLQNTTTDFGIRRIRLLMSGQLSPRVSFFVQFGQNSWNNLSTRKAGSFFHDVTADYAVVKKKLSIGFGLNGWNGPGRFANSSVSSILGLDPPLFQETTNDINDQFVRNLGIYAKGKLGKFDYRIALEKPMSLQNASTTPVNPLNGAAALGNASSFSYQQPQWQTQGYFMYQFHDQESNFMPSTVGSYLGTKSVFNIGAGFKYQNQAMWNKNAAKDTVYHPMALFAIDVFYDKPLSSNRDAITLYGGFFHYDFGPQYLRLENPMNTTNGIKGTLGTIGGTGNGYPGIGTGNTVYGQAAYKFKDDLFGEQGTLQAFYSLQYSSYDALNDPLVLHNMGVNWLIHGNNSKFTLNYESRPIYNSVTEKVQGRRGCVVLQYQVAF
jgi:hypothetical protein